MDNRYFLSSGIIPPPFYSEQSPMPMWQSVSNLNSPPRLHLPIVEHLVKENMPNLGFPMALNHNLPTISGDPGFTERAARFSCFGSRSFNERTSQLLCSTESPYRSSSALMEREKMPRVSSSGSFKGAGSPMSARENWNSTQTHTGMRCAGDFDMNLSQVPMSDRAEFPSSNEGSSVSGQIPNGETGSKGPCDSSSKKRKAASRAKSKVVEAEDDGNTKRCKSTEGNGIENDNVKTENKTDEEKGSPKPAEPPKDYIHVRARRGQATDSHSLAERVRREKIGERMKLLQDLVPGCNKVTGKALMLDEIINYVQSLQRQVEFLSMKLASVNPRLDSTNMDSIFPKDVSQPNGSFPHPVAVTQSSVHPLDTTYCQNIGTLVDELGQGLPQFPTLCEDDLQSIVQMGLGRSPNRDMGFYSQFFPGSSQKSHMKSEL
ncbi:hypothetical protein RHGRI_036030 [Rhododendron griersonianum]|uniref:BHLH domain-containing protein n=1 Tax=Rhododendron griersonianum TaxID=479676 RepID=A0AAV6HLW7_9ERIC|nr:hypothetical protein RHGRI_036030 [Rhododendron griersonianum]